MFPSSLFFWVKKASKEGKYICKGKWKIRIELKAKPCFLFHLFPFYSVFATIEQRIEMQNVGGHVFLLFFLAVDHVNSSIMWQGRLYVCERSPARSPPCSVVRGATLLHHHHYHHQQFFLQHNNAISVCTRCFMRGKFQLYFTCFKMGFVMVKKSSKWNRKSRCINRFLCMGPVPIEEHRFL